MQKFQENLWKAEQQIKRARLKEVLYCNSMNYNDEIKNIDTKKITKKTKQKANNNSIKTWKTWKTRKIVCFLWRVCLPQKNKFEMPFESKKQGKKGA